MMASACPRTSNAPAAMSPPKFDNYRSPVTARLRTDGRLRSTPPRENSNGERRSAGPDTNGGNIGVLGKESPGLNDLGNELIIDRVSTLGAIKNQPRRRWCYLNPDGLRPRPLTHTHVRQSRVKDGRVIESPGVRASVSRRPPGCSGGSRQWWQD
jgi:hypothetical protein